MGHIARLSRIRNSISPDWNFKTADIEPLRSQYGSNDIIETSGNPWLELALETFKDPMIWFLIVTGILFALLKNYNQSIILLLATIPLIGMDAFLHWRTQVSTQSLSSHLAANTIVIRDNREITLPASELVPGDLVIVPAGTPFPADGLIVAGQHLQADESTLTGESFPVKKEIITSLPSDNSEPQIDQIHWGFAGTRLLTGRATLRIIYTGKETRYGEIVASTLQSTQARTPLQKAISRLVLILITTASCLCIILAIVRYLQGFGVVDALLSAAILAVAALPDEFPVVFTFFLGVGVYRLALKNALVRRAVSVENIGRVSVICSDKTGTMTEGNFHLTQYIPANNTTDQQLLIIAAIASRHDSGDLLDLAIHTAIDQQNITLPERIATFPFTENRKCESSIVLQSSGQWLIAMKGAPEKILELSTETTDEKSIWLKHVSMLASSGYKVIACAQMTLTAQSESEAQEPASGYTFTGIVAFSDPPRPAVKNAVAMCQKGEIHIIMITGDHPDTARAIAHQIGLGGDHPNVLLGHEARAYIKEHNSHSLLDIDIIARATPSHKLEIVTALQSLNEIVAVTGDGINDVPALKAGDIGIAMGERGTQGAREAADIILLDDNFDSIVQAISEGRQLFKNLQLSFKYLLIIHMPFVLSAAIIPLLGFPLLYYPVHIVFIELLIHPTSMLVFQDLPKSQHLDVIKDKHKNIRFFNSREWLSILGIGLFTTLVVMICYLYYAKSNPEHARALVMTEISFLSAALTIGLSKLQTKISRIITISSLAFGIALIQIPFMATLLSYSPLQLHDWLVILITSTITLLFTLMAGR